MGDSLQNTIIEFRIICETLFLTFLILKLTDVITWSWWWICTPILCILGLILFFIISMVTAPNKPRPAANQWKKKRE